MFPALSSALQAAWCICSRPAWNPIPGAFQSLELGVACPVEQDVLWADGEGPQSLSSCPFPLIPFLAGDTWGREGRKEVES